MEKIDFTTPEDLQHHFIKLDGRNIHVAVCGSGKPIILVHGWPEFWMAWLPLANQLKQKYTVLMPDLYGFGKSDKPKAISEGLGPKFHANDLSDLITYFGFECVVTITHDVGAWVIQDLMLSNPSKVFAGIFFNCPNSSIGARWLTDGHINKIWYQSLIQLDWSVNLIGYNEDTCSIFLEAMTKEICFQKHAFDEVFDSWIKNFMAPNALAGSFSWYKSINKMRLASIEENLSPQGIKQTNTKLIEAPCLSYWGKHDPILKSEWRHTLSQHFRDIEIRLANNAGHYVHIETPVSSFKMISTFLENIKY